MWVTYFKHRSMHKYTRMARGQDSVEIKSMLDVVQVKRYAVICAGCEGGERDGKSLSDHMLYCVKSG